MYPRQRPSRSSRRLICRQIGFQTLPFTILTTLLLPHRPASSTTRFIVDISQTVLYHRMWWCVTIAIRRYTVTLIIWFAKVPWPLVKPVNLIHIATPPIALSQLIHPLTHQAQISQTTISPTFWILISNKELVKPLRLLLYKSQIGFASSSLPGSVWLCLVWYLVCSKCIRLKVKLEGKF